jgi:hypothetical protein
VIDEATNTMTATIPVGGSPLSVAVGVRGGRTAVRFRFAAGKNGTAAEARRACPRPGVFPPGSAWVELAEDGQAHQVYAGPIVNLDEDHQDAVA